MVIGQEPIYTPHADYFNEWLQ